MHFGNGDIAADASVRFDLAKLIDGSIEVTANGLIVALASRGIGEANVVENVLGKGLLIPVLFFDFFVAPEVVSVQIITVHVRFLRFL